MEKRTWNAGVAGLAAGMANGLFGSGGGMILIPLLCRFCGLEERDTFATALAVMLPLSLISAGVYLMQSSLSVSAAYPYLIGGFFGGICGGLLLQKLPVRLLHGIFGAIIVWGGIRLWF